MTLSKVVRKGSYQGVAQWGISTSSEITPSRKTARKWAELENAHVHAQWRVEDEAIRKLERIERFLIADGAQASIAYGHGNDAAGPEIRGLWDAYQIVHNIRTAWIESI